MWSITERGDPGKRSYRLYKEIWGYWVEIFRGQSTLSLIYTVEEGTSSRRAYHFAPADPLPHKKKIQNYGVQYKPFSGPDLRRLLTIRSRELD